MKRVVIFLSDQLQARGLQHLLLNGFNIKAHIVADASGVGQVGEIDALFTDAITLAANLRCFLPRQSRTIVLTPRPIEGDGSIAFLAYSSTDELIAKLSDMISSRRREQDAEGSMLSQREVEVLRLVVSGCINKEIADRLGISINTVLTHRKNITSKLGIKSVSGLSFYAIMNGIIAPQ